MESTEVKICVLFNQKITVFPDCCMIVKYCLLAIGKGVRQNAERGGSKGRIRTVTICWSLGLSADQWSL